MVATEKKPATESNLVFVHGTFAQSMSDRGDAWWQLDSEFSRHIEKKLRGFASPSSEAFHWSGENSDVFRVFDAAHLYNRLCLENERGPFHVVAHSHGGMVLFHALMLAVEKGKSLENLQSWVTVGTPFIFYKASVTRTAMSHAPIAILVALLISILALQFLGSLLLATTVFLGIIALIFAYVTYLTRSRSNKLHRLEVETIVEFGSRWLGIRSKHDEAITLLKSTMVLNTSIAPKWKSGFLWSYSREGATNIPGRIPKAILSRKGPSDDHPANLVHPNSWLRKEAVPVSGWRMKARKQLVGMVLFWPIHIGREVLQLGYGRVLAPQLNAMAAAIAKARVLGDDAPHFIADHVTDVPSRHPHLSAAELPHKVEEDLLRIANANAKNMISEVRQNYFSQLALAPTTEVFGLWQNVQSDPTRALVHCLYFEHRSCQELIAAALFEGRGKHQEASHKQWLISAKATTQKLVESVASES